MDLGEKMWIIRVLPCSVLDGICQMYLAFRVLSVWWKTSASRNVLFQMVLAQQDIYTEMYQIQSMEFK